MILDCFTFFNELDLLDIRLHTLAPHVDKFVISEADSTFQGDPKPFIFFNSRRLFRSFDSKIIWVPVKFGPATRTWTPWEREAHQRRAIQKHLLLHEPWVKPDDVVLLSDVDEIPDLETSAADYARPSWREMIEQKRTPVVWVMNMTYYWVDLTTGSPWYGTIGMKLGEVNRLLNGDFQQMRNYRGTPSAYLVHPGGWHFSYLGGVDAIKTKINSFAHTEFSKAADTDNIREAIGERWKQGVDLFGRNIYRFRPLSPDERERLPGYLTSHRSRFSGFFTPDRQDQAATQPAGHQPGAADA